MSTQRNAEVILGGAGQTLPSSPYGQGTSYNASNAGNGNINVIPSAKFINGVVIVQQKANLPAVLIQGKSPQASVARILSNRPTRLLETGVSSLLKGAATFAKQAILSAVSTEMTEELPINRLLIGVAQAAGAIISASVVANEIQTLGESKLYHGKSNEIIGTVLQSVDTTMIEAIQRSVLLHGIPKNPAFAVMTTIGGRRIFPDDFATITEDDIDYRLAWELGLNRYQKNKEITLQQFATRAYQNIHGEKENSQFKATATALVQKKKYSRLFTTVKIGGILYIVWRIAKLL